MTDRLRRARPLVAFAALVYLPLLATSRGQVLADTKSYLYIDPDRLLARAWSMWDPHVGMGTVTHQNIGFLWPMGPYYWLMQHAGAPDWFAQRLWFGSIVFAAGMGVRYLAQTLRWHGAGTSVAMCAYALSPYLLTISVRISAILLPFAALPWMLALTMRAVRSGSWRHPAVFALVVATVGTSNATSILLAGLGPALWVGWAVALRLHPLRQTSAAVARIAALTVATNAWWVVGLSVQATNGIDVLQYTESVATPAAASSAPEVLRGLGYWFFYGDDALGPWVGPSRPYQSSLWLLIVTFSIPVVALAAGSVARWRERSFFVLLALVGVALAVGVYPYGSAPPFGRLLGRFLESDVGMAMRSMPRAAPLVVLALSMMLGAGAEALARRVPRAALPASGLVIMLVVLSLPPLWQRTTVPENLRRPEDLPSYWVAAGRYLDATDDGTRVLELPGADFTSYRWGTTVDPVTPGLTDRPIVARELVPMGSAAAANLLKALDGRFQADIAEPAMVAPTARLMRAGQILLRSDLRYEHYDTPRPRDLWRFLATTPGLGPVTEFGAPTANVAAAPAPMLDERELSSDPSPLDPFPVSVIAVPATRPIVTTQRTAAPVIVAGDGDGLVDSAAAGLIDGNELIRYSASLSDRDLASALAEHAALILTDTNRRRAERWGSIRFTSGYTEPAGLRPLAVDRTDARLPVFPDATDDSRTVALHRGGITANATSYGGRNEYLPEFRPANAVDGDPSTSWRASRDDPVRGQRLALELRQPVTATSLSFLAPPAPINRWVTRIALRFDGGAPVYADLDARSRTAPGQVVEIGRRTFTRLSIEIVADSAGRRHRYGGLSSAGFAEVRIGDLRLDEAIRPPIDLLARAGAAAQAHPLAIVLTRLRSSATDVERLDEETQLVRVVDLPTARRFALVGTVRLSPRARDRLLDSLVDPTADRVASSSSRMAGPSARASAAFDGRLTTGWTPAFGEQVGQWIEVRGGTERLISEVDASFVADGRHSVPTRVHLEIDGRPSPTLAVPPIRDSRVRGATQRVRLTLPTPTRGTTVRLVVDAVRAEPTPDWRTRVVRTLPISIAELGIAGIAPRAVGGEIHIPCRDDLLQINETPVAVSVSGSVADALAGAPLTLTGCGPGGVALRAGANELRGTAGSHTGLDLDRLVLRSASGGAPTTDTSVLLRSESPASAIRAGAAPAATVVRSGAASATVKITGATAGERFWLSFGQSWNPGWHATVDGKDLGPPALVDGFANGWLVDPSTDELQVSLRFAPQERVDLALRVSLLAAVVCLALALRRAPSPKSTHPAVHDPDEPVLALPARSPLSLAQTAAVASAAAALGVALVNPVVGALAALFGVLTARAVIAPRILAMTPPAVFAASAAYIVLTVARHHVSPGLEWPSELGRAHPVAWLAVLLLVVGAAADAVRSRRRR
ncbi:MAG: alpha-(1-_3)-arabinofuranosyltransferase domain-containing protein [Microthrixaceae bacterium]